MSKEDKSVWISIKKRYFDEERWDVLAIGLNRGFRDAGIDLKAKVYEETLDGRGPCITLELEKGGVE